MFVQQGNNKINNPLDDELKQLFKYLYASQNLKQVQIDIEDEVKKILKKELQKELQNSLKTMLEGGEFNKIFDDLNKNQMQGFNNNNSGSNANNRANEIDQMVAAALLGGFQTSSVLKNLFGIVPNLIGR